MNKPLGYYTPHTPGDGTLLDQLEQKYGSNFEKFSQREKFYIINHLAISLCITSPGETDSQTMSVANQMHELDPSTQLGLIKFLVDNSSTSNNKSVNINPPDPAWDYYEIWQSLHNIKNKIEAGIKLIDSQEQAENDIDEKLKEMLTPALEQLESVIENDLTDYSDFYEEEE